MTAFDLISTVASGSLLANAASVTSWSSFIQSSLAILAILGFQALLAFFRRRSDLLQRMISYEPLLLMKNGRFCREAMSKARVSEEDIWAKLREANPLNLSEVQAVVLETTGDVSVLHDRHLEDELLTEVRLT